MASDLEIPLFWKLMHIENLVSALSAFIFTSRNYIAIHTSYNRKAHKVS